jgi:endoglucanase
MTEYIQTIHTLADIPGVSGDEGKVREAILAMIRDHADSVDVDPLGNLIVFKRGKRTPKNRILLSAHMDEVGFIITHVEESGLLRFAAVGGIDSRVVVGKAVEVGDARIYGVIGTKAIHQTEEKDREEPLKLDKLHIDIGAKSASEAAALISPGDRAVFHSAFREIGEGHILSKALDDRAGCALLIDLIQGELPYDCTFSFTVQEETGCTGAIAVAYSVKPDIAIAVETTTASDIAGVEPGREVCRFGGGPVVSFMDRGTVYDSRLFRLAMDTAKKRDIPAQMKEGVMGGNESRSLQVARGGAHTLAISLPCRYIHSPSNMLRVTDIVHTEHLLAALIEATGDLAL